MSNYSRLGKNTLLVFVGKLGSSIIGFLMLPLYTRWLGVDAFGTSDLIMVYSSFLITLVTCGITGAVFVFPKDKSKIIQTSYYSSALSFILKMFMLTAIIFVFIQLIARILYLNNSFIDNLWLIYLVVISNSLQQFSQEFTRSIDKMIVFSLTGLVNTSLIAVFAFLFIPNWGLKGYVWSISLASIVSAAYSFFASKTYQFIDYTMLSKKLTVAMLRYSLPLMPNQIMWWLVSSLNRPLMELHLGIHEIGIFAVANRFPAIITMVFGVFATSWQISVLEEFGREGYTTFYNNVFKIVFSILLLILIGLTLSSKLIVEIFAGSDFIDAWHYIPLLGLGVVFSSISTFCGINFTATRESKYFFYSCALGAITSIILNIFLIPLLGTYGTCIALVFSFLSMTLCRLYFSWKYVRIYKPSTYLGLLFAAVMIIVFYIIEVPLFISFVLSFVYVVAICYLNRRSAYLLFNITILRFRK